MTTIASDLEDFKDAVCMSRCWVIEIRVHSACGLLTGMGRKWLVRRASQGVGMQQVFA